MKTNKLSRLNIVIILSVAINLVMLGGVAYIASVHNQAKKMVFTGNSPAMIAAPKTAETPAAKTLAKIDSPTANPSLH